VNRLTVFVHIGAPKSGTTFLQNMLWSHRGPLKAGGVLYPYDRPTEHFEAMLDLREQGWGNISRARVRGAWQRVARRVREWDGHTVILTNELLGRANPAQITRLLESLAPADVHVLYTARDLATQLASSWQEQVKHNIAVPFEEFLAEMVKHGPETQPPFARHFWPLQDAGYVLSRWAARVGGDRISLITVPAAGARQVLWHRFCETTGLDYAAYAIGRVPENVGLTHVEAEFFRRVNEGISDMIPREYAAIVRNGLMRQVAQGNGVRLRLPESHFPLVHQRATGLVETLRGRGYGVVGDLEELIPVPSNRGDPPTAGVTDDALLSLATTTVHTLLRTVVQQRAQIEVLAEKGSTGRGGREPRAWRRAKTQLRRWLAAGPRRRRQ
jgi:hypothetical protein